MLSFLAITAVMIGLVLVGAIPALLPSRTSLSLRVLLLALLFGLTLWIIDYRDDPGQAWLFMGLLPLWGGMLVSLTKVIVDAVDLRRSKS